MFLKSTDHFSFLILTANINPFSKSGYLEINPQVSDVLIDIKLKFNLNDRNSLLCYVSICDSESITEMIATTIYHSYDQLSIGSLIIYVKTARFSFKGYI